MTIQPITIANRQIGPGHPPWIVAEMSANHGRSFDRAIRIIEAAANAGADAVKVQAFSPEEMSIDHTAKWGEWTLPALYREAALPYEWLPELKAATENHGLVFFASVFSPSGVDMVESLIDPPCYKVASFEITDEPLLKAVAATGKPVILSTGMATNKEIRAAIDVLSGPCGDQIRILEARYERLCMEEELLMKLKRNQLHIALLHCVSAYPAPVDRMWLRAIPAMQEKYGVPVGLSDHSRFATACISAVALGAAIMELHAKADDAPTLDAAFSYNPNGLATTITLMREAYQAIGGDFGSSGRPYDGNGCATREEEPSLALRRSIYATDDIAKGEAFTETNIACLRPDKGIAPSNMAGLLKGAHSQTAITAGEPIQWEHVGGEPREQAERIVTQVQGTSALEGQAVDRATLDEMVDKTVEELIHAEQTTDIQADKTQTEEAVRSACKCQWQGIWQKVAEVQDELPSLTPVVRGVRTEGQDDASDSD